MPGRSPCHAAQRALQAKALTGYVQNIMVNSITPQLHTAQQHRRQQAHCRKSGATLRRQKSRRCGTHRCAFPDSADPQYVHIVELALCSPMSMQLLRPFGRQTTCVDRCNRAAHASAHRPPACCRSPSPGCCPRAAPALRGPRQSSRQHGAIGEGYMGFKPCPVFLRWRAQADRGRRPAAAAGGHERGSQVSARLAYIP